MREGGSLSGGEDQKVAVTFCLELMQEEGENGVDAESHHKLRGSVEVLGSPGWPGCFPSVAEGCVLPGHSARGRKIPYSERDPDKESYCALHSH